MILLRESIHSTEDHIQIPRDASRKNPGPFFGFGIQKRSSRPAERCLIRRVFGPGGFISPTQELSARIPFSEQKRAVVFESSTTVNSALDLNS